MYARLLESDASYNGRFFTGVLTTGIYCLPSCKARKPKSQNVRFFPTCEAARAAMCLYLILDGGSGQQTRPAGAARVGPPRDHRVHKAAGRRVAPGPVETVWIAAVPDPSAWGRDGVGTSPGGATLSP
jgi:hypothetical protein